MNTTINLSNYPIFTPNQVLNNTDLNRVVEYLEDLDQLTRTYFVGTGVTYGLEVQHLREPANSTIQITPGCGITSEGFVIQVQPEFAPKNILTHYNETTISNSLFLPGISPEQNYSVKELFPEPTQAKGTNLERLTEEMLTDQVVVVLYDWQDTVRSDTCFLSYDNLGQERNIQLRFFLIPKVPKEKSSETNQPPLSAEELLRAGYPIDRLPQSWQTLASQDITAIFEARNRFFQTFPKVQRFGYNNQSEKGVNLSKINAYETWQKNYVDICEAAIAEIGKAFPELFRLFSPFFSTFHPNSKQDFANLEQSLKNLFQHFQPNHPAGTAASNTEPPYALQYFYDYLSQLVAAYVELTEAVFDLMDQSMPETARFPRFLMLGLVPSANAPLKGFEVPSAYRNQFTQPRIYNNNQHRLQEVRHVYERLLKLCDFSAESSFYLLPFYKTPIKITPSKDRSAPLSEQAIPYYLNYPKLYQYWNYDAYRKGRSDRHPAYFYPKQQGDTTPPSFDDLTYRLDAYNFYRIEGHIGRSNAEALQNIQHYQERYSLPFDVITLKLGDLESLDDLNISAQLDDLNVTFLQLKTQFLSLWEEHQQDWSKNVLLITLKKVFFDQPNLETINSDLLFNHFLYNAKKSERYEFEADANNPASKKYCLFLKNAVGTRIAQYKFRRGEQTIEILNFTGLETDQITQRQKQIIADLQAALTPTTINYAIERQSPSLLHFYLHLVSTNDLTLPLESAGSSKEESVKVELVTLDTFSIQEKPELKILEPTCPDVLTLYGLVHDITHNDEDLKFKIGDQEAAKQPIFTALTKLIHDYNQRIEQWLKLHLFHNFAQQHPGMEPLGGVPKGGTFILVYADGHNVEPLLADEKNRGIFDFHISRAATIEAVAWLPPSPANSSVPPSWEKLSEEIKSRKDIVVADFCLPYRSSSNAPAVSYVLARPRPVLLLQKTIFCEGDETAYHFILEPEGGTVKGEGVISHEHQLAFQPSSISESSRNALASGREIAITFSYVVDDSYDTLTVIIHPKPNPELTVQDGQNLCRDGSSIEIELAPGAPENLGLVWVKINGAETKTLNTNQFAAQGQPESVKVEAFVSDRETECTNTITRTVTVNPLPEATLSIQNEQSFCQNSPKVEIKLAEGTPTELELVQVTMNGTEQRTLDPSQYAAQGQSESVTIAARIRNRQTLCENTLNYTVTIKPLPNAQFRIGENDQTVFLISDPSITLYPSQPGGIFQAQVGGQNISTTVLRGTQLVLSAVQIARSEDQQTIALTYTITQDGCTNEVTREITISAQPAIDALEILTISPDGDATDRRILQDEETFPRSFFTANYQFEAKVNGKVSSVIFRYTSPNQPEEVMAPVNTTPYIMPGNWQPLIGTHTITAQAFSEANGAGVTSSERTIKITITEDETEDENPRIAAPPSEQTNPSQPENPSNTQRINSFFARFTRANDSEEPHSPSSVAGNLSSPTLKPMDNTLLPNLGMSMGTKPLTPINAIPSHPSPDSPWSVAPERIKPSNNVSAKFIQMLSLGGILILLSLLGIYASFKPSATPQPSSSSSNVERPIP